MYRLTIALEDHPPATWSRTESIPFEIDSSVQPRRQQWELAMLQRLSVLRMDSDVRPISGPPGWLTRCARSISAASSLTGTSRVLSFFDFLTRIWCLFKSISETVTRDSSVRRSPVDHKSSIINRAMYGRSLFFRAAYSAGVTVG